MSPHTGADGQPVATVTATYPSAGVAVISVAGELDTVTTPPLRQLLLDELDAGHRLVVVELSGCEFMSSSGLAALVEANSYAEQKLAHFVVVGCGRTVSRAIAATGLGSVLRLFVSADDAIAAVHTD